MLNICNAFMFQLQALQLQVEEAEHQTWREKQTSRMLIAAAQEEALDEIEEAQRQMEQLAEEMRAAYEAKAEAESKSKAAIREERRLLSEQMEKKKAAADDKLEKERRGYEAIMEHMRQKHDREKGRLTTRISDKDAEMADVREQHLSDIDKLQQQLDRQAKIAHQEKSRRRQTEQKVLDAKAECTEHIKAMDAWLMELADELKVCVEPFLLFYIIALVSNSLIQPICTTTGSQMQGEGG